MAQAHKFLTDASYFLSGPGVSPGGGTTASTLALEKIISQVVGVLTIVAVVWFGIQLILAGYAFITSEGDKNKMETARKRLTEGVLGLTIVVVSLGLAALIATLFGLGSIFNVDQMLTNIGLPGF